MRKIINFLFISVLLCANCAIVHADPEFTTPIDDGKVILDYNEKSGFQKIAIQDQDAINDLSDTMVKASADGIISGIYKNIAQGTYSIVIDHGNGYQTLYSGLEKIDVELDAQIDQNTVIAQAKNNKIEFIIIKDGQRLSSTKELLGL